MIKVATHPQAVPVVVPPYSRLEKGRVKNPFWRIWLLVWKKIKNSGGRSFAGDLSAIRKNARSARGNGRRIGKSARERARICARSVSISVSCNRKPTR